jgi:hypothetical protein
LAAQQAYQILLLVIAFLQSPRFVLPHFRLGCSSFLSTQSISQSVRKPYKQHKIDQWTLSVCINHFLIPKTNCFETNSVDKPIRARTHVAICRSKYVIARSGLAFQLNKMALKVMLVLLIKHGNRMYAKQHSGTAQLVVLGTCQRRTYKLLLTIVI